MSEDRCVCCGEIVPEGTHICYDCQVKANEPNEPNLNQGALQSLEDVESEIPCDMMGGSVWCSEHCHTNGGAKKECWKHYLIYGRY